MKANRLHAKQKIFKTTISRDIKGGNVEIQTIKNNANLIVSVESRKGGVGKTTAALCLARLLTNLGWSVLFLDLDITGTNTSDIVASPFWGNAIYPLKKPGQNSNESNSDQLPINLLNLFERHFMAGKILPEFSLNIEDKNRIHLKRDKVNLMGSQIYNDCPTIDEVNKNKNNLDKTVSLNVPSILFDEIHSIWFLEFVKKIIENFAKPFASKQFKIAVILDNSPGFVGIAPAIHDWLTNCGPVVGKFLTVSSLDAQDLLASERSIRALHSIFENKWATSRTFFANSKGEVSEISKNQEAFYLQLASAVRTNESQDLWQYYFPEKLLPNCSKRRLNFGEVFCKNPEKYLAAIINRVPRAIKSGSLYYDWSALNICGNSNLSRLLGLNSKGKISSDKLVSFDEYIENQFLLNSLRLRNKSSKPRYKNIIKQIEDSSLKFDQGLFFGSNSASILLENLFGHEELIKKEFHKANSILQKVRLAIYEAGFSHLSKLIENEWFPESIILNFKNAISDLLQDSEIFPNEYMEIHLPLDEKSSKKIHKLESFKETLSIFISKAMLPKDKVRSLLPNILSSVYSCLVNLAFNEGFIQKSLETFLLGLFVDVIYLQTMRYQQTKITTDRLFYLTKFLTTEGKSADFSDDEYLNLPSFKLGNISRRLHERTIFLSFYKACSIAAARLIDFTLDTRFLLQLLQFVLMNEMNEEIIFPFIRGLAEDVIIEKSIPHENAPAHMAKSLSNAEYFREFDRVLNGILKEWDIEHANP